MAADLPMHAVRDGDVRVIYVVGNRGGLYKFWPDTNEIMLMKGINYPTEAGHMVGYAGLAEYVAPAGTAEILVPTSGWSSPGGVWNYLTGELLNNGLPAGEGWIDLKANWADPNEWLLLAGIAQQVAGTNILTPLGNHPLWYTADAGANWQAIPLTQTTINFGTWNNYEALTSIVWSRAVAGDWFIMGSSQDNAASYWHGNADTFIAGFTTRPWERTYRAAPGQDNDLVVFDGGQGGGEDRNRLGYAAGGTGFYIDTTLDADRLMFNGQPFTKRDLSDRMAAVFVAGSLYLKADYRVTGGWSLTAAGVSPGSSPYDRNHTVAANGKAYIGGRGAGSPEGVLKISDVFSYAPASEVVADTQVSPNNHGVQAVAADEQTGTRVAVRIRDHNECFLIDTSDDSVTVVNPPADMPAPSDPATLANVVEIIVRT
jgi:hypothetical protein